MAQSNEELMIADQNQKGEKSKMLSSSSSDDSERTVIEESSGSEYSEYDYEAFVERKNQSRDKRRSKHRSAKTGDDPPAWLTVLLQSQHQHDSYRD